MNHVLALVRAARSSSGPGAELQLERLRAELLALHEETLAQLRLERLGAIARVDFLTGMIEQHQDAVRAIQAQLDAGTETEDMSA